MQTRLSNWLHPLADTKQLIFSWDSVCFWNSHLIQQHGGENGDEEKARGSQVGAIGPVNVLHPHLIQMFKLGHRGHGGVVLMVNSVQILCAFIANFLENFYDPFDIYQWQAVFTICFLAPGNFLSGNPKFTVVNSFSNAWSIPTRFPLGEMPCAILTSLLLRWWTFPPGKPRIRPNLLATTFKT